MRTTARKSLAFPARKILQRGDLGRVLLPALGWPTSASLPVCRCCRLSLPSARLIGLPHRDEALSFDRFHAQAAAGCGPTDGGAQTARALPLHERHPHWTTGFHLG